MRKSSLPAKKNGNSVQWRVARTGVRFTVKQGRETVRNKDGQVRTFRTRDAAQRVARELNQ